MRIFIKQTRRWLAEIEWKIIREELSRILKVRTKTGRFCLQIAVGEENGRSQSSNIGVMRSINLTVEVPSW